MNTIHIVLKVLVLNQLEMNIKLIKQVVIHYKEVMNMLQVIKDMVAIGILMK